MLGLYLVIPVEMEEIFAKPLDDVGGDAHYLMHALLALLHTFLEESKDGRENREVITSGYVVFKLLHAFGVARRLGIIGRIEKAFGRVSHIGKLYH